MNYKTTYPAIRDYSSNYSIPMRWIEEEGAYFITLTDKDVTYYTTLNKGIPSDDLAHFETNIKPNVVPLREQLDNDGAQIVRIKAAKRGWTFAAVPIQFITSEIDSLYSKLSDGTNRQGITLKFYNQQGSEITTEGLLQINETTIIRTVIDFEPNYDYEIIGGTLRVDSVIGSTQDCRLWITAVPDIPAASGGSKEMAGGINLKFLSPDNSFYLDGRVSKTLVYDPVYKTNKIRFIFEHTAGLKLPVQIVIDMYRM